MMRTAGQDTETAQRLDLVEAPPRAAFDSITHLSAALFGLPLAAISITDTTCQWLVSSTGQAPSMTPHAASPCYHVAKTAQPLAVSDLSIDPEYQSGLLAGIGMRFYAGAPLLGPGGGAIGALCVMGPHPGNADPAKMKLLQGLAVLTMDAVALHRAARVDPLSGLPNRLRLLEDLGRLPPGQARQLALLDLAQPEELSHMLHTVGSACLDEMVRQDSHALRSLLARTARLFHVAPTQFALLAPTGTDPGELALRLHGDLSRGGLGRDALFSTTCSVGLATVLPGHAEPAEMLRQAKTALDDARVRRSPIGVYLPEQDAEFRRAFTLLNDFASALTSPDPGESRSDGLRLVFQPRLELATGHCVGVEALLRWTHPTLGEISPAEFIRLVEKTTMARGLMHWVLDSALAQLTIWRKAGLRFQLSINVSPANLEDDDFAAHVLGALDAANLPPAALELEITESALLNEAGPSLRQLRTLSETGICIAIDDFGTGYSSLSYLQRLPADVVKIDQSFVQGLSQGGAEEHRLSTLIAAMIGLSHDLGYRVVAEGIETQGVADLLLSLKCDEVQGYWFARPMAPAAFTSWYAQRAWRSTPGWQTPARSRRIIPA